MSAPAARQEDAVCRYPALLARSLVLQVPPRHLIYHCFGYPLQQPAEQTPSVDKICTKTSSCLHILLLLLKIDLKKANGLRLCSKARRASPWEDQNYAGSLIPTFKTTATTKQFHLLHNQKQQAHIMWQQESELLHMQFQLCKMVFTF